jgi:hypothetical protein
MNDAKHTEEFSITLTGPTGSPVTLKAQLRGRRTTASGEVDLGVEFIDLDEKSVDALITAMFGDENVWSKTVAVSGIWKNIWWLLSAIRVPFSFSRTSLRRAQRISCNRECQVIFSQQTLSGTVKNISEGGLMVEFSDPSQLGEEVGRVHMGDCVLQVRRMWSTIREGKVLVGFRVECIREGGEHWQSFLLNCVATRL